MRWLAHLATLIGLAALGAALGDFASGPNVLGALGLCFLVVVLLLAVGQLYRPGGIGSRNPARKEDLRPARPAPEPVPAPSPEPEPAPRRKSRKKAASTPLWSRGERTGGDVASSWDAGEADEARERRRAERQRRRG